MERKTIMVASEMDQADGAAKAKRKLMKQLVAVVQRGEASYWTRIGVAFENRDGSWNLRFDFVPTAPGTTIQLRGFRVRPEEVATVEDVVDHGDHGQGIPATPF
jgi:hypothetical protein